MQQEARICVNILLQFHAGEGQVANITIMLGNKYGVWIALASIEEQVVDSNVLFPLPAPVQTGCCVDQLFGLKWFLVKAELENGTGCFIEELILDNSAGLACV